MERLEKLPLSAKEKGWIFATLSQQELEREMPNFLDDEAVATSLRIKFLPAESLTSWDTEEAEVAALAASIPEFPLDQQPTREALERYLHDFRCLEGLVPVASKSVLPQGLQRSPFFISDSHLGLAIAKALQAPRVGSGEIIVNSRMLEFLDIFYWLKTSADIGSQLDYHISMDKVETASSAKSSQTGKRKRPDFLVEHREFLFLLGEGKDDERKFGEAINEISETLNVVPDWLHRNVNFLLGFALAGVKMQLFVKRASAQQPEQLTKCYALDVEKDRVQLVLVTIKLYFLCLAICKRVVPTGMLPLFKKHMRNFSTIELDGEGCAKTIENWKDYKETFGVSFGHVKKAYEIPRVDQLVYAISLPAVSSSTGRYMVRTAPLGLPARHKLTDEHECKSLAKDVLIALAALHEVNLVHRDIRLDNVIWWPLKKCYVLIDLETVAAAGKEILNVLTDYNSSTLVSGKYVKSSDLHQLGVLLEKLMPLNLLEPSTCAFVNALKSHQTTAKTLLTNPWLLPS